MRKLAALMFCLMCAQRTLSAEPRSIVINSAVVDSVSGLLLVSGKQFGTAPVVTVDGIPATVLSGTPEALVVVMPASVLVQPGTYILTVERDLITVEHDASPKNRAAFVIAVGATGPQGPRGPAGETGLGGPAGPQGPAGETGSAGPVGPQGPAGETGPAGQAGPRGPAGEIGPRGPEGARGFEGPSGRMGLTGPKGDNGAKGDTGPAGQGSLRVVDAKGSEVGMYVGRPQPGVIREVNGTFVEIPLNGSAFASCSTASASCIMYSFEEEGCTGTAYLQAGDGLTQDAIVADDGIFYPSGPVATLTIKSIRIDAGRCIATDGTQPSAVMKWAPLSSLGFTAPFHLAK